MPLRAAIAKVINGQDLSFDEAAAAMDAIMDGAATPAQIGSYLTALRMKRETVDEIAGSAGSMRRHVIPVDVPLGRANSCWTPAARAVTASKRSTSLPRPLSSSPGRD